MASRRRSTRFSGPAGLRNHSAAIRCRLWCTPTHIVDEPKARPKSVCRSITCRCRCSAECSRIVSHFDSSNCPWRKRRPSPPTSTRHRRRLRNRYRTRLANRRARAVGTAEVRTNAEAEDRLSLVEDQAATFYIDVLTRLRHAGIPFLVGGAFALFRYTGTQRETKDLDIFTQREDVADLLAIARRGRVHDRSTVPTLAGKDLSRPEHSLT